jgi:membrane protease YdiL (CAAX protease family)
MKMAIWFSRHPVVGYFMLVYGISWGGILIFLLATGFNLGALPPLETVLMFVLMLLGPSTSGLILTASLDGRDGLRRLWGNLTDWRVDLQWYAIALLTTPLLLIAILWPLSGLVDSAFAPRFQWPLFAIGLIAGSFEEIGWTGFATPRLLSRESLPRVGLWLGVVWALWHLLVDFRYNYNTMGGAWLLQFAVFYVATLTGTGC